MDCRPVTAQFDNRSSPYEVSPTSGVVSQRLQHGQIGFHVVDHASQTQRPATIITTASSMRLTRHMAGDARLDDRSASDEDNSGVSAGKIDEADYSIGEPTSVDHAGSGSGAAAAVPEPASLWLLLCGTLTICSRRWPKGRKLINV